MNDVSDAAQNSAVVTSISTFDFAAIIVDGLVDAGVLDSIDIAKALSVVVEKMEARKLVGDY
ncbi:MAG: hypothetical protein HS117_21160 [Verrucomicrobiaceae bacterium]|nr:hypothetical protein [Verrucomicrobiaceae bacterium]